MSGFVFDGHGGSHVSVQLAHLFPNISSEMSQLSPEEIVELWKIINKSIEFGPKGGSTCSGFLCRDGKWSVCNCGDSRTYIIDSKAEKIVFKTQDHKPENEIQRISQAGGFVLKGRVNGYLAVSRSFGDKVVTGVIPDPDVTIVPVGDMAVSVTDGVTDVMSDDEILSCVLSSRHGDGANNIISRTKMKLPHDNISAVVAELF